MTQPGLDGLATAVKKQIAEIEAEMLAATPRDGMEVDFALKKGMIRALKQFESGESCVEYIEKRLGR